MKISSSIKIGAAGFVAVTLFAGAIASYEDNERRSQLSNLRLSERKTSTLSLAQREDVYKKEIYPLYGSFIAPRSPAIDKERDVLERVCIDGTFGSQRTDWDVDINKVVRVYDQCGWTLPKDQKR